MKGKIRMGIRKKAALFMVVLILLPTIFIVGVSYNTRHTIVSGVQEGSEELLLEQAYNNTVALNNNATLCIGNYLKSIEISAESAAQEAPYHLGRAEHTHDALWTSAYLLTQVNHTEVQEIMDGDISNTYYDEMLSVSGDKEMVDAALYYLVHTPALNYSDPHINESAYEALNQLGSLLFSRGSRSLYSFLYSVLLPEYRAQLDQILPISDMLYSFRGMPDLLWSYYADEGSGFSILVPPETHLSPLFNSFVRPWYVSAKSRSAEHWSMAYVDELTGCPVSTYSSPVFVNGTFSGVVGFDILLSTLTHRTETFYISNTSFAFMVSGDGVALTYPDHAILGKDLSAGNEPFNQSIREILTMESGSVDSVLNGREVILVFSTVPGTEWRFINVLDVQEFREKAKDLSSSTSDVIYSSQMLMALLMLSTGIVVAIVALLMVDRHTRDIEEMSRYADEISRGNMDLDIHVNRERNDEMGDLQRSFKRMVNSLKVAMRELERGNR